MNDRPTPGAAGAGRWRGAAVVAVLACLFAAQPYDRAQAQQVSNASSRLNLDRCTKVDRPGSAEKRSAWRCKGFKNDPDNDVYVYEEDGRFHISFGRDAFTLKASGQTLEPANRLGDDLEWRIERRAGDWEPFAAIARYFTEIETDDGGLASGEVLVVYKVGQGEACQAAFIDVDANTDATRLAHQAADGIARRFHCDSDQPVVVGNRGTGLGPEPEATH